MKKIPKTKHAPVLRTDFSDDQAWESICAAIAAPVGESEYGELKADVDFVSDPEYDGLDAGRLPSLIRKGSEHAVAFLVDRVTLSRPDRPILVVDLGEDEPGRTFRAIPSKMCSVENNLSLGNMDFEEFAEAVGRDGVFRGFPED